MYVGQVVYGVFTNGELELLELFVDERDAKAYAYDQMDGDSFAYSLDVRKLPVR